MLWTCDLLWEEEPDEMRPKYLIRTEDDEFEPAAAFVWLRNAGHEVREIHFEKVAPCTWEMTVTLAAAPEAN